MPHPMQMAAADTGLLVIDMQEKLLARIPGADALVAAVALLADAARLLDMTVLATEQYPRGLGPTVAPLAGRLPERPDKMTFSCCGLPSVVDTLHREARPKVVLAGVEAHVCVLQTALDLLAHGFRVFVPADAVASRFPLDHQHALGRLAQAGAAVTTAEACVFEWAGTAAHPRFKALSTLVLERARART